MVPFLYTPRDHHSVKTPEEYAAAQARAMAKRQEAGSRVTVHDSPLVLTVRIDHNSWIVDCECGAGNAVDPDWPVARCFGCGAVHAALVWPEPTRRAAIERALLVRAFPRLRSWRPVETVEDLDRENATLTPRERTP